MALRRKWASRFLAKQLRHSYSTRSSNINTSTKSSGSRNNQRSVPCLLLTSLSQYSRPRPLFSRLRSISSVTRRSSATWRKSACRSSWITTLGILKAAGALGLLIGIGVPAVGIAAATGLVLFFIAAIITHLRGHDYSFGLAIVFLLLAIAALGVRVISS